jgi:VWFA-related protein
MRSRSVLSTVSLLTLSVSIGAQQPSAPPAQQPQPQQPQEQQSQEQEQPRPPVIRRGINFVRVDVIVTDRDGNPVLDLKPEDFEVTEEGKPQQVETFQVINVGGEPAHTATAIRTQGDIEREAQREDVRVIAIVLDDYHVRRGASMVVREPLERFLQQQIAPTDLVGIMYPLTPVTDFNLTRNHDALISAVRRFEGRKYDYNPRNEFEERYAYYPASIVERIRNEVTLSALRALVTHLGGVREGRKAVILVSEGFTNVLPPQLDDPVAAMPGVGNPNRGQLPTPGRGETSQEFFRQVDIYSELRDVYAAANRSNTSIYTLDPRGLSAFEYDINEGVDTDFDRRMGTQTRDTLMVLADETDGRAIVNRNDLDSGLRQIVRDSSGYYLIGYNSTLSPTDGKFHQIRVRVRRPGVQVRARKGYWAYSEEDAARATASASASPANAVPPEVERALSSMAAPRGRRARTWVGTSRAENGGTRVTFSWEPTAALAGPGSIQGADPEQVTLTAIGQDGRPYFRGKVVDGTYRRCEPDFIVVRYGIWAVVEVDGENWHHETPQQAHARLQGFEDQGARVIRVPANIASGPEWAKRTVDYIAERFEKFKLAR